MCAPFARRPRYIRRLVSHTEWERWRTIRREHDLAIRRMALASFCKATLSTAVSGVLASVEHEA
jgi:hypothetical protein